MALVDLAKFGPDLDPRTPGVITTLENMIPTTRGYKGIPSAVDSGYGALAAEANSLAVLQGLDGVRRVFAGTISNIYELTAGSWTSRGSGYSIGANRWQFAQFGSVALAAAKAETLQASTSTTFGGVGGAPKSSLIAVSEGFVMIADTNDGTYGDQSDRWWCSAYLDYTDWTPATSTQCATGRLIDVPGPIYALESFGSGFVAYKERGIFVGQYVGAPLVWQWTGIPGGVGCNMANGVVNLGSAHAFIGPDNIYVFDGSRPIAIGNDIKDWFFDDLSAEYAYRTIGVYNQLSNNVWWFYVSSDTDDDTPNKALVYNGQTGRFGVGDITVEAASIFYAPGVTYDGLGSLYSTYSTYIPLTFDSPYWSAARPDVGVISTDHKLKTLTGGSSTCSMQSANIGDDNIFSTVQRVMPRFLVTPGTATMTHRYDNDYGDSFTDLSSVGLYESKFDTLWSSRWHAFLFQFSGDVEINGFAIQYSQDGDI